MGSADADVERTGVAEGDDSGGVDAVGVPAAPGHGPYAGAGISEPEGTEASVGRRSHITIGGSGRCRPQLAPSGLAG